MGSPSPAPRLITGRKVGIGAAAGVIIALATPIVQQSEGRRLDPYYDVGHVLTVCDGETKGVENRRYTNAQCDAITTAALARHEKAIRPCYPADRTPDPTQLAYLSLAYNIGAANFCGSSVARLAKAGDFRGSCNAMLVWNKVRVNGRLVFSNGLDKRRHRESLICLSGLA